MFWNNKALVLDACFLHHYSTREPAMTGGNFKGPFASSIFAFWLICHFWHFRFLVFLHSAIYGISAFCNFYNFWQHVRFLAFLHSAVSGISAFRNFYNFWQKFRFCNFWHFRNVNIISFTLMFMVLFRLHWCLWFYFISYGMWSMKWFYCFAWCPIFQSEIETYVFIQQQQHYLLWSALPYVNVVK